MMCASFATKIKFQSALFLPSAACVHLETHDSGGEVTPRSRTFVTSDSNNSGTKLAATLDEGIAFGQSRECLRPGPSMHFVSECSGRPLASSSKFNCLEEDDRWFCEPECRDLPPGVHHPFCMQFSKPSVDRIVCRLSKYISLSLYIYI